MGTRHLHLFRRGAIYYWRARLPNGLREVLCRKHLVWSLRTPEPTLARQRARRFSVAIDSYENWLMNAPTKFIPTRLQLRLVLESIFNEILAEGEAVRDAEPEGQYRLAPAPQRTTTNGGEDSEPQPLTYSQIKAWTDEDWAEFNEESEMAASMPDIVAAEWHGKVRWNQTAHAERFVERALEKAGLSFDQADPQYAAFIKDTNKVIARAYAIDYEQWEGRYDSEQKLPSFVEQKYGQRQNQNGSNSNDFTSEEAKFLALPISQVAKDFIAHRKRETAHKKTPKDDTVTLKYFLGLVGDLQFGDIKKSNAEGFVRLLRRVPNLANKGLYKGLSPKAAINLADQLEQTVNGLPRNIKTFSFNGGEMSIDKAERNLERLTKKTTNKHLTFFTSMWQFTAVPERFRKECPFSGCLFTKAETKNEGLARGTRFSFSDDDLKELFSTPVWAGCSNENTRTVSGNIVIRDWRYWGPLLALYTGMRLEEISSLHAGDFNTEKGIWYISITGTDSRYIKSDAAKRHIPVHSRLIQLGFQDFVTKQGNKGAIFKELIPSEKGEKYGNKLGKWFGYYRQKCGIYQRHKDFHSLRHNFVDKLLLSNVPEDQVAILVGHESANITRGTYGTAGSIEQKKANIECLEYNLPLVLPSSS